MMPFFFFFGICFPCQLELGGVFCSGKEFFQQCFFLCCSDKEQNFYDTGIPGNYLEFKLSTEAEICIMFVFCL